MTYTRHIVPRETLDQVEAFKQQILDGELDVVDIRVLSEDAFAVVDEDPTCAGLDALHEMMMQE